MSRLHLPPRSPMFQHHIENRQQLPQARRERDLLRFARSLQTLIEGANHRIESGGEDGAHIENGADLCASAPHGASSSERAAIAIEWRDTHEGGDLLVRQCAQFRKTGNRVEVSTGPTPSTLCRSSSLPRHTGLWRIASASSALVRSSSRSSQTI